MHKVDVIKSDCKIQTSKTEIQITFCNDIYLTFVEHIKLFSSVHPNYRLSLEENQRKSSEGFY